ncbi:hypothetical protein MUY14_46055 [Amycolatopsis sp. FBCC-B4732]|uniref:hypothetical protein n=1 Tax=Amycolatopsis sp. FBCC-B4732 TaxID=3079339 RepID=UPI001FF53AED|nr:hypothetical protein [Amycolatopsis sp. FBCC-B4732]UOX88951.1 hypothetical protein MUY14_46055 [Amycolatopsis sp. FBCC-B4732]
MNALTRIWHDGRRAERLAYVVGAALFLSGAGHAVALLATGGSWLGPLSLRKAVTFGLSFGLTLASVAWATSFLTLRTRWRAALLGAFTAASVVEVVLVSLQAWRGVPSHFNFETPFDNVVSMTLAAGGGVLIVVVIGFTAAALVEPGPAAPSLRLAVRAGLLVLLVALATGAVMVGRGVVAARGGDPQLAYTTAGALKPLHAVAMHAILVLPGLAWLLRSTRRPEAHRLLVVKVAVAADAVLTAVIGVESFTGTDPFAAPLPVMALSALAALVLAGTGGYALSGGEPRSRSVRVGDGKARGR